MQYEIVIRSSENDEYDTDGVGSADANRFETIDAAESAIEELRSLRSGDFAEADMRVRIVGEKYPVVGH